MPNIALCVLDLIGPGKSSIDASAKLGPGARGIQALVGKHRACRVVVCRDLPARQIDALQASFDHLHRLISRRCPKRGNERLVLKKLPKPIGSRLSQRVVNANRAAQPMHIFRRVCPVDSRKSPLGSSRPIRIAPEASGNSAADGRMDRATEALFVGACAIHGLPKGSGQSTSVAGALALTATPACLRRRGADESPTMLPGPASLASSG